AREEAWTAAATAHTSSFRHGGDSGTAVTSGTVWWPRHGGGPARRCGRRAVTTPPRTRGRGPRVCWSLPGRHGCARGAHVAPWGRGEVSGTRGAPAPARPSGPSRSPRTG